jgi:hypothetical protein
VADLAAEGELGDGDRQGRQEQAAGPRQQPAQPGQQPRPGRPS